MATDKEIDITDENYNLLKIIREHGSPEVADAVHEILLKREARFDHVLETLEEMNNSMKAEKAIVERLNEAFPANDPRGHREAHETWMEREAQNKDLKKAIIDKSITALVFGAFVFIVKSVWESIKKSAVG